MLSYKISISISYIHIDHICIYFQSQSLDFISISLRLPKNSLVCIYQRLTFDPNITSESNRKDQGKFKHTIPSGVYSGTRCV